MSEIQSNVVIPLSKNKKIMTELGGICFVLAGTMVGSSIATLQSHILTEMNAMEYFSLLSIISTLGLVIMTPIGAKIGDIIGRRNVLIVSGIACVLACIGMGFIRNFMFFAVLRLIFGMAQGAYISSPYILARELNEPKDVPKSMGALATSIAAGGFVGSIVAGILKDMGRLDTAIMFPSLFFIIGIALIYFNLPNKRREGKVFIDIPGIITLSVSLVGILLSLNFGSKIGWTDIKIITSFLIGITALAGFIQIEKKSKEPIISMHLFKNRSYVSLLIVGFICYFYMSAMSAYAPLAVQKVLGASGTVAGALQMPRTIITMILPIVAGIWISKDSQNAWKAMGIATLFVAIPYIVLSRTTVDTSVMLYFIMLSITGIAESFRGVSITPAAQATLKPENLGVGTSLVNFANTLAILISSVICGIAYDLNTKSNPKDVGNITAGVNSVFMIVGVVNIIGFLIVMLVIRKQMKNDIV